MMSGSARIAHVVAMVFLTLSFVLFWLPLVRTICVGPSYEWGSRLFGMGFSGAGIGGDWWFLWIGSAAGIALLWTGWRGPDRLFRPLAFAAAGILLADAIYTVASGNDATFEGATLGVSLSIGTIQLCFYALLLALLLWSWRSPTRRREPLARINTTILVAALMLLPLQYALLSTGQGQEARDAIGVFMTMGQWVLISFGFGLPARRGGMHEAVV